MQMKLYRLEDDASLSLQSLENISAKWVEDETRRWLAIEGAEGSDVVEALACFELDPLILEALTEEHTGSRMTRLDRAVLISFPIYQDASGTPEYLTLLCLPSTIITITLDSNPALRRLSNEFTGARRLFEPTVQALLYSIFDTLGDLSVEPFFKSRRAIATLAEQLEDDSSSCELSDILENKRIVGGLVTTIEDQLYCVNTFMNVSADELGGSETQQHFRDMIGVITLAQSALYRLESQLQDLHQHYLLTLQDTTNERLKLLTVLSTIYLPSTLIAGIYGMNFPDIPATEITYGYFVVLAIMILLVVGQLGFFYWRGWFK
jgi:magnesium transporter